MLAWLISSGVHPRPRAILDIIKSGESFRYALTTKMPEQGTCEKCGYISSQVVWFLTIKHFFKNLVPVKIHFAVACWVHWVGGPSVMDGKKITDVFYQPCTFCVDRSLISMSLMRERWNLCMQKWCKACVLLDGLNRGLPRLGIGRTRGKSSSATGIQTDNSSSDKQTSIRNDKRILKPSLDFWSIMVVSCDGACIINIQPTYRGSCQSKLLHGRRISWKVWSII
jgi:hypothetical protein